MVVNMSDSRSDHPRDSQNPAQLVTGTRLAGLQILVGSLLVALAAVGCSGGRGGGQNDEQAPVVEFPQHHAPTADYWTQSFVGQLVLEEGCLRASSLLLIWPRTFTFDTKNGVARIVDKTGRIAAHVGDDVRFSRASVSYEEANGRGWIQGLSADCAGPYWLVGDEVAAFSLDGPAELPPPDPEDPEVYFPQHDAPPRTDNGGLYFAGQLVLDNGCLRVGVPYDDAGNPQPSNLLIWPGAYRLSVENGAVSIVDELGRIAARVGDYIRLPFLEAVSYKEARDRGLIRGLPADCAGPYELVSNDITAFNPNNEPTELRLLDPEIYFHRQKTKLPVEGPVEGPVEVLFDEIVGPQIIGELVLDGHCLRLKIDSGPLVSVVWPPGFAPHVHRGAVHVRNGAGRIVVRVGDELATGGGQKNVGHGGCPGPTSWIRSIKVLSDAEVYFPKQDGTLGTDQEMDRFEGKLIMDGKCLVVDSVIRYRDRALFPGVRPLLIWPDTFTLNLDDEVAGIVDATGRTVARVGDEVQFSAVSISYQEALEHGGLEEITPACSGPGWVVGDDFAAVVDSESP